jgi:hypothetical protein
MLIHGLGDSRNGSGMRDKDLQPKFFNNMGAPMEIDQRDR